MKIERPQVITMGEVLIDFVGEPAGVGLAATERFARKPGGAPANVAVGVRRLGVPSAFVGMVGADAFGAFLRSTLEEEGVDVRGVVTTRDQPTTLAFVALEGEGVPSFVFVRHPGADQMLAPGDVAEGVFDGARAFHFGSLSLGREPVRAATHRCLALAEAHGLFVSYDPNHRPALWADVETARATMLEPIGAADLVKVSAEELGLLTGEEDVVRGCDALGARGAGQVVVTRGAEGMTVWTREGARDVPGKRVSVVDTTGCGDTSVAALLVWLLRRDPALRRGARISLDALERAARFANRCAAITAQGVGAIPSMPRLADVRAFLDA